MSRSLWDVNEYRIKSGVPDEVWERIVPYVETLVGMLDSAKASMSESEYRRLKEVELLPLLREYAKEYDEEHMLDYKDLGKGEFVTVTDGFKVNP